MVLEYLLISSSIHGDYLGSLITMDGECDKEIWDMSRGVQYV